VFGKTNYEELREEGEKEKKLSRRGRREKEENCRAELAEKKRLDTLTFCNILPVLRFLRSRINKSAFILGGADCGQSSKRKNCRAEVAGKRRRIGARS